MRAGVLASLLLFVAVSARAGSALDGPPFSASPQDLLAAAHAAQPSDEDVVLRADVDIAIDRGRITYHWHALVAVRTDDGAESWGDTGDTYRASDQSSTVRARVIDPQGQVHAPDPSQVTDVPASGSGSAATDEHVIDVPLTVTPGSVVEVDLVRVDRAPVSASGAAEYVELGNLGPASLTTLHISAPTGERPRVTERDLPAGMHREHTLANGRETWTYALGPTDLPPREWDGAVETVQFPLVGVSTIPTWSAVARELGAGIDRQIAAGPPAWPAGIAKTPTLETARAITQWVRETVPAHGLTPDDTAFRAATPADVLAGRAADNLSIAALTCALLRQAGLHADVALSLRWLAEPGLASLALDTPVVRATIGGADVWIDPLHARVPVGHLAQELHGRRVLVLGDSPAPLVTTPSTAAAENELREVRTFDAPPTGFVNVTEVDHATGDLAVAARDRFARSPDQRARELAANRYTGELASFAAPSRDLDAPAETTLVVTRTHRGASQLDGVHIYLSPRDVTDELPAAFVAVAHHRRHDLELPMPFAHEIENRILWPDGYEAPEPAPDRVIELPGLRFTEQQRVDGTAFVVTYRLEATRTHYTPDEVDTAREALKKLEPEMIEIPSTAWRLYRKHELRDAIAAARQIAELHPHEAVYRDRLAELLVNIGAGSAARREARAATQLEPKRAAPWMTLGWVLEHDALARRWADPGERAAARAALETARELDPTDVDSAVNLAELLQVDARGHRVTGGADLRGAIRIWREIVTRTTRHDVDLGRALLWNGDAAEAEAVLQHGATGSDREAPLVVATALAESPATAVAQLADRVSDPEQRQNELVAAARLAVDLRAYTTARALVSGIDPAQLAGLAPLTPDDLQSIARNDAPFAPGAAPADAVIELALERLHPERPHTAAWDAATDREIAGFLPLAFARGDPTTVSIGMADDIARSTLKYQFEGDSHAWRVDATLAGERALVYVAADRGRAKIIGAPDAPAGVGRHVLRLLAEHEDASAKRLLDWIANDVPRSGASAAAFAALWGDGAPTDRAEMLLAGAALAAPTDAAHALPIVTACNATTAQGQRACDATAAAILEGERRWPELLRLAAAWENRAEKADAVPPAIARATALLHLGHFADADDAAAAGLALAPSTPELMLVEAADALGRGAPNEAWLRGLELAKSAQATPAQLAYLGWLAVATGGDLAAAADAVETGLKRQSDADVIDALAAVELEAGQLAAGYADADRAMTVANRRAPTDADWYAFGRYWELLGLRDDAIAAYKHIAGAPSAIEASPAMLAKLRLAALGVKR